MAKRVTNSECVCACFEVENEEFPGQCCCGHVEEEHNPTTGTCEAESVREIEERDRIFGFRAS